MRFYTYPCVFGHFCLVTEEDFVCGIEVAETATEAAFLAGERFSKIDEPKTFEKQTIYVVDAVRDCIDNGATPSLKLKYKFGTWLQTQVWAALSQTKVGEVLTYKELAKLVGQPTSIRPVASAVGENPIAIIVPCHRVIRQDGKDSGYRWGLDLKKKLLLREELAANPKFVELSSGTVQVMTVSSLPPANGSF